MARFVILTGEYPPARGGVADYTRTLAEGLARCGEEVHVIAPGVPEATAGVEVHGICDRQSGRGREEVKRILAGLPGDRIFLVQYTPQMFGMKGMNVPFAWWLWGLRRRERVWVMFHEVRTPWASQPFSKLNVLAAVTRLTAWLVAGSAERIMVSTEEWKSFIGKPVELAPVPSNIRTTRDPVGAQAVRARLGVGQQGLLICHFGTYGVLIKPLVAPLLQKLLAAHAEARVLLLGRGGKEFAAEFIAENAGVDERVIAAGNLSSDEVADHLTACDLAVQPYSEGATTRRGSLMAGLALGVPIVTTTGVMVDKVLLESGAMVLAAPNAEAMAAEAEKLIADAPRRAALRERAAAFYRERFAMEHTIALLRAKAQA